MIKFRGTTKEGKVVEGYYFCDKKADKHIILTGYISIKYITSPCEVLLLSLAMSTGIKDKNDEEIFGSFPVDGVMSEGGSEVEFIPIEEFGTQKKQFAKIYYSKTRKAFCLKGTRGTKWDMPILHNCKYLEVIPKQETE
jgi:hypothetical protein